MDVPSLTICPSTFMIQEERWAVCRKTNSEYAVLQEGPLQDWDPYDTFRYFHSIGPIQPELPLPYV